MFESLLKGNAQFIFLCNPSPPPPPPPPPPQKKKKKSCASQLCITFLQVTKKILTKEIFYWLELITEILSFLRLFSVTKTPTLSFYNMWKNNDHLLTNPSFLLKFFFDDAFLACLCLLASHY